MKNSIGIIYASLMLPLIGWSEQDLSSKVVRVALNQNQPALIRLGTQGITTLEFPTQIEALDGYGFSMNPNPAGPDQFQISFNKGTNFLSLKALRPGVAGNLTVVLGGKVYSLYCKEVSDPSFLVIFQEGAGRQVSPGQIPAPTKAVSPARLLGFLDKIKGFPTLKVSAPEIFHGMDIAEPNTQSNVNGVDISLHRVIRDDSLDSVGFEIELINRSDKDFLYDPEGLAVRAGNEVFQQSVSDAGGMVPAGKTQTAFFVVTGTSDGDRNDLAVTNKFDIIIRPVNGPPDPQRKVSAQWVEPPTSLPGQASAALSSNGAKSARQSKDSHKKISQNLSQPVKKNQKDDRAIQHNS